MPKLKKLITKINLNAKPVAKKGAKALTAASRFLEFSVSKAGGPVSTRVDVGSSGTDDQSFTDAHLTPGPVQKPLIAGNFYVVVWSGAFLAPGAAKLQVKLFSGGKLVLSKVLAVKNPPTGATFALVVL